MSALTPISTPSLPHHFYAAPQLTESLGRLPHQKVKSALTALTTPSFPHHFYTVPQLTKRLGKATGSETVLVLKQ